MSSARCQSLFAKCLNHSRAFTRAQRRRKVGQRHSRCRREAAAVRHGAAALCCPPARAHRSGQLYRSGQRCALLTLSLKYEFNSLLVLRAA